MFIKYIGRSDIRVITGRDWDQAEVKNQATSVWNKKNQYAVPISEFTPEAVLKLQLDPDMVAVQHLGDSEELLEARIAAAVRRMRARQVAASAAI